MAVVSTDTNLADVTYTAGEIITITNGATVTVNSTPTVLPGTIQCITFGGLRVINTSTTTPIVLTLFNNERDFQFERNGIFNIEGDMIDLTAGTGSPQSWDFTASPLDIIPYPSYVEVEDSPGSGLFTPRLVFCTAGKPILIAKTLFGASGENGNILFWNHTTRQLESGNGVNGNVIPTGCRVRIPNIYIHSNTTVTTQASRTLVDLAPTGRMNASCVAFSDHIWLVNAGAGDINMNRVGWVGQFSNTNTNFQQHAYCVSVNADTTNDTGATGWNSTSVFGACSYDRVAVTHSAGTTTSNAVCMLVNVAPNIQKFDNILSLVRVRGASNVSCYDLFNMPVPDGIMRNIVSVGANMEIYDMSNITFINHKHTDRTQDTNTTGNSQAAISIFRCRNIRFINFSNAGSAAARLGIVTTDTQTENIQFFGGSYDCNGNTVTAIFGGNGKGLEAYNMTLLNIPTGAVVSDSPTTFLSSSSRFFNIRGTLNGTGIHDPLVSATYDGIVGTANNFATGFAGGVDFASAHLLRSGLSPTAGDIVFAGFGSSNKISFTGQAQLNQAGSIELFNTNDSVIIESDVFRGITGLTNTSPFYRYSPTGATASTTPQPNVTYEFAVATATGPFSDWQLATGANLAAAIPALSNYDRNEGLRVRIRVTANTNANRLFTSLSFQTDYDSSYSASDSTILLRGPNITDVTSLYLSSDNSLLASKVGPGIMRFPVGANIFQGAYFVRRDTNGVEIMRTQTTPFIMEIGNNGTADLFSGPEIQLAQSADVLVAKNLIDEVHALHGLDRQRALTVTDNTRVVGSISQTITDDGVTTTVTRQ